MGWSGWGTLDEGSTHFKGTEPRSHSEPAGKSTLRWQQMAQTKVEKGEPSRSGMERSGPTQELDQARDQERRAHRPRKQDAPQGVVPAWKKGTTVSQKGVPALPEEVAGWRWHQKD